MERVINVTRGTQRLGMQVGTQWCFLGQLINYDSMPL
jgi:hypothetical protein